MTITFSRTFMKMHYCIFTCAFFLIGCTSFAPTEITSSEIVVLEDEHYVLSGISGYETYSWEIEDINSASGLSWDVYFTDEENCEKFLNGGNFLHSSSLSWEGFSSSGSKSAGSWSSSDNYCFIVDNSDKGATSPPSNGEEDKVHIHFRIYGE